MYPALFRFSLIFLYLFLFHCFIFVVGQNIWQASPIIVSVTGDHEVRPNGNGDRFGERTEMGTGPRAFEGASPLVLK